MNIGSSLLTLSQQVDPLTDSNWHTWKEDLLMVLRADGLTAGIIDGTVARPSDPPEAGQTWDVKDSAATAIIWSRLSPSLRHLARGEKSGKVLFAKLKAKFEASTWSRRIALRSAFHRVQHDASQPVDQYIQTLRDLKGQLATLGEEISDVYFKDVLLAGLDPAYESVRNSLLSQLTADKKEVDLDTTISMISGATYIQLNVESAADRVLDSMQAVKSEPIDAALATRFKKGNSGKGSTRDKGKSRPPPSHDSDHDHGFEDSHGHTWCSPTNEGCCHRCGRFGHIAARCYSKMPEEVESWLRDRAKDTSNIITESSHFVRPVHVNFRSPSPTNSDNTSIQSSFTATSSCGNASNHSGYRRRHRGRGRGRGNGRKYRDDEVVFEKCI